MKTQEERYFEWLCNVVVYKRRKLNSYSRLLNYLFETPFEYSIDLDVNRADDGLELRYNFDIFDNQGFIRSECTILEMLVALALRCENIMENPDEDNCPGEWFWGMIENLGLGRMSNSKFDINYINDQIDIFLKRKYKPNGEGGLFTIPNCKYDLREVEIWYQMCWYLDTLI